MYRIMNPQIPYINPCTADNLDRGIQITLYRGGYAILKADGTLICSNQDKITEAITNNTLIAEEREIEEIASNGRYLFVRTKGGDGYRFDNDTNLVDIEVDVARVTPKGFYIYTGEYCKSGTGDAGLVPLLLGNGVDNILAIFSTPYDDGIVYIKNGQLHLKYRENDVIHLGNIPVVGFLTFNNKDYKIVKSSSSLIMINLVDSSDTRSISSFGSFLFEPKKLLYNIQIVPCPNGEKGEVQFPMGSLSLSPIQQNYVNGHKIGLKQSFWKGVGSYAPINCAIKIPSSRDSASGSFLVNFYIKSGRFVFDKNITIQNKVGEDLLDFYYKSPINTTLFLSGNYNNLIYLPNNSAFTSKFIPSYSGSRNTPISQTDWNRMQ